jgi:hypothetical protein
MSGDNAHRIGNIYRRTKQIFEKAPWVRFVTCHALTSVLDGINLRRLARMVIAFTSLLITITISGLGFSITN